MNIDELLSPEQREALAVIAESQGRTLQELVSQAIDAYVLRETGQLN